MFKENIFRTNSPLEVGSAAPNFSLKDTPDQAVSLSEFKGKPVILVFYPSDFSPICSDQISVFNEALSEFKKFNAQVLGISVDNIWSHLAFARERGLRFPLLSDFHPKGQVSKLYNVYREDEGRTERALYVVDSSGKIAMGNIAPIGINPGIDEVLKTLNAIKTATLQI